MCYIYLSEGAPVIDVRVIDITLNEGDTAFFSCKSTGIPIPNISWYFNGAQVKTTSMISEIDFNPTTKRSTLKIVYLDSSDIGEYTCNATNIVASNTSSGNLAVDGESVTLFYDLLCNKYI